MYAIKSDVPEMVRLWTKKCRSEPSPSAADGCEGCLNKSLQNPQTLDYAGRF